MRGNANRRGFGYNNRPRGFNKREREHVCTAVSNDSDVGHVTPNTVASEQNRFFRD